MAPTAAAADIKCLSMDLWTIQTAEGNFLGVEKKASFFNLDPEKHPVLICGDPMRKPPAQLRIYPEVKVLENRPEYRPNFEKLGPHSFKFWLTPTDKSKKRICVISCE